MNPTSKTIKIPVDGKMYDLYFDMNTFSAFETATNQHFTELLNKMRQAYTELLAKPKEQRDLFTLTTNIGAKDVRAFIWAALHTYDADDNPVWPFTINQLGRRLDIEMLVKLVPMIMEGNAENAPDVDKDSAEGDGSDRPTSIAPSTAESGGAISGPSDADVLAFLETN